MLPERIDDEHVPTWEQPSWPRVWQSGLSVIGAAAVGVACFFAGGGLVMSGGSTPPVIVSYNAPATPTHDAVVFANTGDSLRIIGSAFEGTPDTDTHDSTQVAVDTAGTAIDADSGLVSPRYFASLGAVLTDTVPALDSGGVFVSRIRYKGANGGWSAWSDSLSTTMTTADGFGPGANEPANVTAFMDYDPATHGAGWVTAIGTGTGYSLPSLISNWNTDSVTVDDAGAPNGRAALQIWPSGKGGGGGGYLGFSNWRSFDPDNSLYPGWADTLGLLDTLYVRFSFKKNAGWEQNSGGEKLGGLTMDHGDNNLDIYIPQVSGKTRFRLQGGLTGSAAGSFGVYNPLGGHDSITVAGDWYEVEMLIATQSACGVEDGSFRIWVNGVETPQWIQIGAGDTINSGDAREFCGSSETNPGLRSTNAFPWYWGGSGTRTQTDTISWGGIYMSGSN